MLVLQLLPYKLVGTAILHNFVACVNPQYQMTKHHYFSQKAVPALHHYVTKNVSLSLQNAVTGRVHLITHM